MFQTLRAFKFWLENVIHFQKQIFYIDELLLERLVPRTVKMRHSVVDMVWPMDWVSISWLLCLVRNAKLQRNVLDKKRSV